MERKRILISVISGADNNEKSAPTDVIAEKYDVDELYIIHTAYSEVDKYFEGIFNKVCDRQRKKHNDDFVKTIQINNSIEYGVLMKDVKNALEEIYAAHHSEKSEYFINFSSGLPQIKSVFIILKEIGFLKGELIEKPKAKEGALERVKSVNIEFLSEMDTLDNVKRYLKKYDFINCRKEMEHYKDFVSEEKRIIAESFIALFKGYENWDSVNYAAAKKNLEIFWEILDYPEYQKYFSEIFSDEMKNIFSQQYEQLRELNSDYQNTLKKNTAPRGSLDLFIDNYYFASRNFEAGEYVNILSMYLNMRERIIDYFIYEEHQNKFPGKNSITKKEMKNIRNGLIDSSRKILYKTDIVHKVENVEKSEAIELETMINERDALFINHGRYSIEKKRAKKIIKLYKKVLEETFKKEGAIEKVNKYPFNLENIKKLRETLNGLKNYSEGK